MTQGHGHKANEVFAPRGAWQSGASADFFALGYEPFGALLPGRNYSSSNYRFGFQGQEKDDEMHGATGTSYNYTYRMHDPRVGRFLSIDPLAAKYPYYSPYAFSGNRVIDAIELEGLEPELGLPYTKNSDGEPVLKKMDDYSIMDHIQATYTALANAHEVITEQKPTKANLWIYWKTAQEIEFEQAGLDHVVDAAAVLSAAGALRHITKKGASWLTKKLDGKSFSGRIQEAKRIASNPFLKQSREQLARSERTLTKRLNEHKKKLDDYINDPLGQDNQGRLRDAQTPEQMRKIYEGRVKDLKEQIGGFEKELEKVKEAKALTE